ncbi:MAG TPA: hypothetical protein VJZ50_11730 [Candidatus Limnocylindrales bacterium]|nr:hypothetical protein [Candidatus Limnocylindrales bacterium]
MAEATEKQEVIEVPKGYNDGILEHQHWAVRGENTTTCKTVVMDPQKKVGQRHTCTDCGQGWQVVAAA